MRLVDNTRELLNAWKDKTGVDPLPTEIIPKIRSYLQNNNYTVDMVRNLEYDEAIHLHEYI